MITATRFIEFDAGHRVFQHESKCNHPHGHRYKAEIEVAAPQLDTLGRVMDFGKIKELVGKWIDDNWDHAFLFNYNDKETSQFLINNGFRRYGMTRNPTAENMADELSGIATRKLMPYGMTVVRIRIWETPNCFAEWRSE